MNPNSSLATNTPILTDFSATAIITAINANMVAFFAAIAAIPSASSESTARYQRWANPGILSPMFNGVIGVNMDSDVVEGFVRDTKNYFNANAAPLSFWWVTPTSQPSDLAARYLAQGLTAHEIDAPGMAVDLNRLVVELPTPDGFQIKEVNDETSLRTWAQTFIETFEVPEFAGQSWIEASLRVGIDKLSWRMYIGWLNDQPVGVSLSFSGGGVAGLWALAVSPKVRRSGIGAALTIRPMLDARNDGYRIGVLFATELGVPLYERLGYRTYCTISRYLWREG